MKTAIELAKEAGFVIDGLDSESGFVSPTYHRLDDRLERLVELVRTEERTRADALAATISALRDIVTSDAESKGEFIARVRGVLGACPDMRVLHAVEAEREACARICDELNTPEPNTPADCADAIRARSKA